jgi:anti-sigma B factor antagonist
MVRAHEWDASHRLARAWGGRRPWWVAHPPPSRPPSRLEWESAGAHAVVGVTGDVDDLAEPELEAFVAGRWLAGCTVLEVDLSGVWSMSSVGLSVLLGVHRWCEQRGLELRLRDAPPSVWRVFEAAGLDATFAPAASHDAARPPAQELALF